jgi:molybdopterin/thiamine biosynthesis adenylyltransferase
MQPWWMAWPGRVEHEYRCLDAAGIRYVQDEDEAERGVLQLHVSEIAGEDVDLTLTFPDLYPFFRPAVRLRNPEADWEHHLQPFSGDLCLIGRDTARWSTADNAAWLLTDQLPKALALGRVAARDAHDVDLSGEDPQAEPFSEYYTCFADEALLLVDSGWQLPAGVDDGDLDVRLAMITPEVHGGTLGAVFAATGGDGGVIATLEGIDERRFPLRVRGRWLRLNAPVRVDDSKGIWKHVHDQRPDLPENPWVPVPGHHGLTVQVLALVFPEERSQRELGDGWMFLIRTRRPGSGMQPKKGTRGRTQLPTGPTTETALVRAGYAGRTDLTGRMPELEGLAGQHVLLVGLGALGSVAAEHLARAGVGRLTLVDRDRVEPGNLVRHAAQLRHVGWSKAKAVSDVAFGAGLYCEVVFHNLSLGAARWELPPDQVEDLGQQDALAALIDAADVVIDCSAEKAVRNTLAWICAKRATPLIVGSATNGGWGGRVVTFAPHMSTGCWSCLEHHLHAGTIPAAPAAPEEVGVQPVGCAEPTFTGTGFDLAEVALHTVRTTVGILQADSDGGYPPQTAPVQLLALRNAEGTAIPPRWTAHPLPVHPACTGHGSSG